LATTTQQLARAQEQVEKERKERVESEAHVARLEATCADVGLAHERALLLVQEAADDRMGVGTEEMRVQQQQMQGQLLMSEHSLARAEAQLAALRPQLDVLESKCAALDVERESAQRQLVDRGEDMANTSAKLLASSERCAQLESAALQASASIQKIQDESRDHVDRAASAHEIAAALAEAKRAALEEKIEQLTCRVVELKDDKHALQSTLSDAMGRAGDATM